jgi:hypothetical protein
MKKLLRIQSNERVDFNDFKFLAGDGVTAQIRELVNQFICNPTSYNQSIISGFGMSNPSGSQVRVDKGKAILHQRVDGSVIYSILATEGEDYRTVDISTYPDNTYNIYIRFDQIPSDTEGRIFWNPVGNGSEYTQAIETRYSANWSIRVETSTPGEEWFLIGTVIKPGMSIIDKRDFYFEGSATDNYKTGWSSDGGGSSIDRHSNRSLYGVTDLHTFVRAMQQCLIDIKGRGLRNWWEKDIGGMNVGFDDDPTENVIGIGDPRFFLKLEGSLTTGVCTVNFNTDSYMKYGRVENSLTFTLANKSLLKLRNGDDINVNGGRILSCCLDDAVPGLSTYKMDQFKLLEANDVYTGGNSNTLISRASQYYKGSGVNIFPRNQLLEGLNVVTGIDHYNGGSFSIANKVNSIKIEPGVAYINGSTIFVKDSSGQPLVLSDLWNGDVNGGLTAEAKTYIGSVTNGYENCFCLYIWLRKDGTFWLEPFGPDIGSRMPWVYGGPRVKPRSESGLPQTGFRSDEYLLVDTCWLVHGKSYTGSAGDIINLSGAIYTGGDYRAFEVANYLSTEVDGTILNETGLTPGYHYTNLDYADTGGAYQKRSPGIPGGLSRRARIAISGSIQLNASATVNLYVGYGKYTTGSYVNCDLIYPGTPFHISEENNFGSTININFGDVIDIDSSPYIDATASGGGRIRNKVITFLGGSGTYSVNLVIKVLGFYWNRKDVNILSRSIETVS